MYNMRNEWKILEYDKKVVESPRVEGTRIECRSQQGRARKRES